MKHISPRWEWEKLDVEDEGDEWFDAFGVDEPKVVTQFAECTVASHWLVSDVNMRWS